VDRATKEHSVTPKFVLSYKPSSELMLYAQAAKGYRIGQTGLAPPVDPVSGLPVPSIYGPDSLWNYEAGLKSTLAGGRLIFNAAAYYIDWKDIQLQNRSAAGFVYIVNAGKARSEGLEIEARFRPVENVELGTALSFNSTKLLSVEPGVIATVGDRLPGAPKFTAANYVEVHFNAPFGDGGWIRLDHQYFGKAYSDLNNSTALTFGDFNTFNARLGLDFGKAEAVLFVDNIGDSNGVQNAVFLPAGPSAVRLRPRTIGVTLRADF
jgi:outer membrane receptor protein involved in Fe transport